MAARDYHQRRRADRTLQSGPGTVDILRNAVGVVLVARRLRGRQAVARAAGRDARRAGPVDALGKSWALMDGSVSATFAALVVVLAAGFAVGAPVLLVTGSKVLASLLVAIVAGVPSVGVQTYRYVELTGSTATWN